MEWQLAILLALVSLVIIGFIYFDAKRRSRIRKERVERELYQERLEKSRDASGFDDDGIGKVRLVGDDNGDDELESTSESPQQQASASEQDDSPDLATKEPAETFSEVYSEDQSEELKQEQSKSTEAAPDEVADKQAEKIKPELETKEPVEPTISESDIPVLDDALFEFTKESLRKEQTKKASNQQSPDKKEPTVGKPQQTSLFDEPDSEEEEPAVDGEPELIFSLFVVAEQEKPFKGPELVQTLVEQGMRHGDMDIFHRHAQSNGRGAVQFSLANAFEPGIFELKKVDDLETRGLALFMALPGPQKPMKAYDLMVKTARAITQELGGFVLDASKSNFSKQIESHHREQIVEFERKQLLHK